MSEEAEASRPVGLPPTQGTKDRVAVEPQEAQQGRVRRTSQIAHRTALAVQDAATRRLAHPGGDAEHFVRQVSDAGKRGDSTSEHQARGAFPAPRAHRRRPAKLQQLRHTEPYDFQ